MEYSLSEKYRSRLIALMLLVLFLASIFFPLRALTSICTAAFFLFSFLFLPKWRALDKISLTFIIATSAFFLLQLVSFFYANDQHETWKNVWMKSAMVALAFGTTGLISQVLRKKKFIIFYYCLLLFLAIMYCLAYNATRYFAGESASVFFYYELVTPLKQHAIYFSVYTFTAIVFLTDAIRAGETIIHLYFYFAALILFSVFLVLLSSKLVIVFFILYIVSQFFVRINNKYRKKTVAIAAVILLITVSFLFLRANPLSSRFTELFKKDLTLVKTDQNSPADYFNGLEFRLLQWKLIPQILRKKNAWLLGVSPGDAQSALDNKYIERNMYTGNGTLNDRGFLGYYAHNTFLEVLLQNGITGILILSLIYYAWIMMIWRIRKTAYCWIIVLIIGLSFTESYFESQYGIVVSCFFPLFVFLLRKDNLKTIYSKQEAY